VDETEPKKMVNRSVAIALGIICIILVACLGGAVAVYTLMINEKSNTISSLNLQISQLNSSVANLKNQVTSENSTINSLTSQVANLQEELYPNTNYTVFGVLDGWEINMTLEKVVYSLGEPINITITVTNISNQTMNYYLDTPTFDFRVYNDTNDNLYQWSNTQIFLNLGFTIPFSSGESLASGNLVWPQTYNDMEGSEGFPVSPGTYYIVGQQGYGPTSLLQTDPIQITIV
jgi:cell division protein FtsL